VNRDASLCHAARNAAEEDENPAKPPGKTIGFRRLEHASSVIDRPRALRMKRPLAIMARCMTNQDGSQDDQDA